MCILLVSILLTLRNYLCNERSKIILIYFKSFPHIDFSEYDNFFTAMVIMAIILTITMGLMVLSLFMFHSLMSFKNMTTWEYKSWKRISYLKDFP